MEKSDFKKLLRHLYMPSARDFSVVDVPPMNFLMIDGAGDPNTASTWGQAMEALYAVSFTLKFMLKTDSGSDYVVPPLEGLWWTGDMHQFSLKAKDKWQWTAMIMQPPAITSEAVAAAVRSVQEKKDPIALPLLRFAEYHEGSSAQILYGGPYDDEAPVVAALHQFIADSGHELRGRHHEIYLSDPRRTAPERLRTVIRQPFA